MHVVYSCISGSVHRAPKTIIDSSYSLFFSNNNYMFRPYYSRHCTSLVYKLHRTSWSCGMGQVYSLLGNFHSPESYWERSCGTKNVYDLKQQLIQ